MISVKTITENPELLIGRLKIKNFDGTLIVNEVLDLDRSRRQYKSQLDELQHRANTISKEIGVLFKQGRKDEAEKSKSETTGLKDDIKNIAKALSDIEIRLNELIVMIPNVPHESVPPGTSPEHNQIIRSGGAVPDLFPGALPHWELAVKFDLIDFEAGNKITGAGFPVYRGRVATLQRALINYFLNEAGKAGFQEIIPPILVNEESAFGTGQLPDKEGQMYHAETDNLYLIPTAEVPLTNIYRGEIVEYKKLPVKITAYTPCFRREAGSYGKDVRGLNRLHQFDKVEIVQIDQPESSYLALENMVGHVEKLVLDLKLPYRILLLCGGDMSFHSSKTYDFEVFSAAQSKWLEVSSVSNFESFQANRMMLRYRNSEGKINVAHTLNGSALALPRIMAAILENYQEENFIKIPEVLIPYTGFSKIEL